VHRDVKPGNVLLAGRHAYLGDFGLTRAVDAADAQLTDTGERLGTVDFMSPEHLRGLRTDARSDVYALGCLLYTLLTGTPPFHRATPAATVSAHLEDPPPRVPSGHGIPSTFDGVLARALAKEPADRYPSAGDLGRAAVAASRGKMPTDELRSVARGDAAPQPDARSTVALTRETTPLVRERAPDTGATVAISRPRNFRHPWIEVTVIAALLAIGAIVTVVALSSGGSDPTRPLSSGEVATTARAFAGAYGREDTAALRTLLAAGVERVTPADTQRGRQAVLAQYRQQFRANRTRAYRLDGLTASGGPAGRAAASFTVERDGRPPITGRVVLGITRMDGQPRILLIATESRS